MNLFLEAFHNKTINNNSNLKRNLNIVAIDCTDNNETNTNYNSFIKEENDLFIQDEIMTKEVEDDEEEVNEDLMNIFESLKNNLPTNNIIEDSFDFEYDIVPNKLPIRSSELTINDNLHVVMKRIDLTKYKQIDQYRYLLNDDQNRSSEEFVNSFECNEILPSKYKLDSVKYKELRARRPSPNRNNISKLNLFRNIFQDYETSSQNDTNLEIQSSYSQSNFSPPSSPCKTNDHSLCDSGFYSTPSKYYRLNDLVSVMINEDYLNKISNEQDHVYEYSDDDGFDENELANS
jgi:hypothetical protein